MPRLDDGRPPEQPREKQRCHFPFLGGGTKGVRLSLGMQAHGPQEHLNTGHRVGVDAVAVNHPSLGVRG